MRRNHAGKNVSRSAGRHSRIPRSVHPGFAIRLNHQRSVSFKHDNHFMLARKTSRHPKPVLLHICGRTSQQPSHFPRMWSDHQHPAFAAEFVRSFLESVQTIRIENDRDLALAHQSLEPTRTSLGNAKSPVRSRARFSLCERVQSFTRVRSNRPIARFGERLGHQLGMESCNRGQRGLRRRYSCQPGSGSQRRHPGHRNRPRLADRTSDHEHVTVIPFVRLRRHAAQSSRRSHEP